MFVALWEFEVKPGCEKRFEKVYGPEGGWAKLFRRDRSYLQTRLLRDTKRARVYVTLDFWTTRAAYERFMNKHAEEYQRLDAQGEGLTTREKKMAWCET